MQFDQVELGARNTCIGYADYIVVVTFGGLGQVMEPPDDKTSRCLDLGVVGVHVCGGGDFVLVDGQVERLDGL